MKNKEKSKKTASRATDLQASRKAKAWSNGATGQWGVIFGQATIEFTFAMIATVVLLMGMIQAVIWAGKDLAARRRAHEVYLTDNQLDGWEQTNPTFYRSAAMGAAVRSDIYNEVTFK